MRRDFKNDSWDLFNIEAEEKDIYLFGAGNMGRSVLDNCKKYSSTWRIKGFVDNDANKIGMEIEGVKVYSIDDLLEWDNYVVLICTMYPGVIANQLHALGIKNYWAVIWMDDDMHDFLKQSDVDIESVNLLKKVLYDETSKELVDRLIEKRKAGFMDYTDVQSSGSEYFRDEFFSKSDEEAFIDCGGYDGDTIDEFCKWTDGKFKSVYSFEPDECILKRMHENLYRYDERVHIISRGVYSHETTLSFINTDGRYSGHIEQGDNQGKMNNIECVALDDVVKEKVTFIKMDIEGSEIPALRGAKNIILRDKPKLAICIYHKPDDLWEIPLMIKEWVPEYRMHIRHFGRRYYSTVLYAYVP